MEIREATMDDFEQLFKLKLESKEDERKHNKTLLPIEKVKENYRDYLERDIKGEWRAVFIAIEDNRPIGMIIGRIYRSLRVTGYERRGSIGNLYVTEKYRKKGVAKKLLEALTQWFRSREATGLTLTVYKSNRSLIDMYKKFSFKDQSINMYRKI